MLLNRASTAGGQHRAPAKERQHDEPDSTATTIDTRDLKRTFKTVAGPRPSTASISSARARARFFGFLAQRGGEDHHAPMLATLIRPTAGEATVAGVDLLREHHLVRQRIGYVPQGGSTDPADNWPRRARHPGLVYDERQPDAKARATSILAAWTWRAAADRLDRHLLRGGLRRRLDVGLGIVHRPQVLFLDGADHRPPAGAGPDVGRDSGPSGSSAPPSS